MAAKVGRISLAWAMEPVGPGDLEFTATRLLVRRNGTLAGTMTQLRHQLSCGGFLLRSHTKARP